MRRLDNDVVTRSFTRVTIVEIRARRTEYARAGGYSSFHVATAVANHGCPTATSMSCAIGGVSIASASRPDGLSLPYPGDHPADRSATIHTSGEAAP